MESRNKSNTSTTNPVSKKRKPLQNNIPNKKRKSENKGQLTESKLQHVYFDPSREPFKRDSQNPGFNKRKREQEQNNNNNSNKKIKVSELKEKSDSDSKLSDDYSDSEEKFESESKSELDSKSKTKSNLSDDEEWDGKPYPTCYKPNHGNANDKENIIHARVKNDLHNKEEKTGIAFKKTNNKTTSHPSFIKTLEGNISELMGNTTVIRPIDEVVEKNKYGSPITVKTPNGSLLERVKIYADLSLYKKAKKKLTFEEDDQNEDVFDSKDNQTNLTNIITDFTQSTHYEKIQEFKEKTEKPLTKKTKKSSTNQIGLVGASVKKQSMTITEDSIRDVNEKKRKHKYRVNKEGKYTDQNKVMGISANEYVKNIATLSLKNVSWQWLHLICYSILGPSSQDSTNLVAGTSHANTDMMLIERLLKFLSQLYPDGFDVNVTANLVEQETDNKPDSKEEYFHVAKEIHYEVKAGEDFEISINFDPQTDEQPYESFIKIFEGYVKTLVEIAKQNSEKLTEIDEVKENNSQNPEKITENGEGKANKNSAYNNKFVFSYQSERESKANNTPTAPTETIKQKM